MQYNPKLHHRRSIRLKHYDYSQAGFYFITLRCHQGHCLFGEISQGFIDLNPAGIMLEDQWRNLEKRFSNIKLHDFVVMPNHFHGIIELKQTEAVKPIVGDVVGAFKSLSTVEYIRGVKTKNWSPFNKKFWQRNYYEHIIRNENAYLQIVEYIQTNPLRWENDRYHP
jgi:REP element-mobilizing transposase RayT